MKKLFSLFIILLPILALSQTQDVNYLRAKDSIRIAGKVVKGISNNATSSTKDTAKLITEGAIKNYVGPAIAFQTFDSATRGLITTNLNGVTNTIIIPRGGSVNGISALSNISLRDSVKISGDNGSTTTFNKNPDSTTLYATQTGLASKQVKGNYTVTVSTIDSLMNHISPLVNTVIVSDSLQGGTFNRASSGTVDNGIVFPDNVVSGNSWKRQFTGSINVKWYGIKGDGIFDNQRLLNALLSHDSISIFFPKGNYRSDSDVNIIGKNVTIVGEDKSNTTIFTSNNSNFFLFTVYNSDVSISNLGFSDLSVKSVERTAWLIGIAVDKDWTGRTTPINNISIQNCNFTAPTAYNCGVTINAHRGGYGGLIKNVRIDKCNFKAVGGGGITALSETGSIPYYNGITITNNYFLNLGLPGLFGMAVSLSGRGDNNLVNNNIVNGYLGIGFEGAGCSNTTFSNNYLQNAAAGALPYTMQGSDITPLIQLKGNRLINNVVMDSVDNGPQIFYQDGLYSSGNYMVINNGYLNISSITNSSFISDTYISNTSSPSNPVTLNNSSTGNNFISCNIKHLNSSGYHYLFVFNSGCNNNNITSSNLSIAAGDLLAGSSTNKLHSSFQNGNRINYTSNYALPNQLFTLDNFNFWIDSSGVYRFKNSVPSYSGDGTAFATVSYAGTPGSYHSVTTDVFGRVISGSNPYTLAGYGIIDAASLVHGQTFAGQQVFADVFPSLGGYTRGTVIQHTFGSSGDYQVQAQLDINGIFNDSSHVGDKHYSIIAQDPIGYKSNIHSQFGNYDLIDKSFLDSVLIPYSPTLPVWSRTGTTINTYNVNDSVSITGNIKTTKAIKSASLNSDTLTNNVIMLLPNLPIGTVGDSLVTTHLGVVQRVSTNTFASLVNNQTFGGQNVFSGNFSGSGLIRGTVVQHILNSTSDYSVLTQIDMTATYNDAGHVGDVHYGILSNGLFGYKGNYHSLFGANDLVDKSYVDSVSAIGGINYWSRTGTMIKPVNTNDSVTLNGNLHLTALITGTPGDSVLTVHNGLVGQLAATVIDTGRGNTNIVTGYSLNNVRDSLAALIPTSGIYQPVLTNTTNISSSSVDSATWTRSGNIVTVRISGIFTPTVTNTSTTLTVTLPITTTFTTQTGVGGCSIALNAGGLGYTSGFVSVNSGTTIQIYSQTTGTVSSDNFVTVIMYKL